MNMLRKSSIALGATLTLVGSMIALPSVALAAPTDSVSIPDVHLREAVKAAVGHQPDNGADPTEAEMATIRNLDLSGRGVTNLDGIQYATSLMSLNLSGNSVGDITPLVKLPALNTVDLSYTPVATIAPLENKSSLSTLNLKGTETNERDAEATFASLPNLTGLDVSSSNLADEVVYAKSVIELVISDNGMTDLDGYEALTNLKYLSADNNPFENLDGLKGRNLDYLKAGVTKVRDLSGITAQSGKVTSEVPLTAAVGQAVDVTVKGAGDSGTVGIDTNGDGVYRADENTVTYGDAGTFKAGWAQASGQDFTFTGSFNVGVDKTAPSAVSDFEVSGRVQQANLRWATPNTNGFGDVKEYNISYSNDGFATSKTVTVPGNENSVVLTDLAGGNYTARIVYTTSDGGTSPDSTTGFSVYAEEFAAPTKLAAKHNEDKKEVTFTWDGVTDAPSYVLTVRNDLGKEYSFVAGASNKVGQTFTVADADLGDNARYTFTVEVGDAVGSLGKKATTSFNPNTGWVGDLTAGTPATNVQVDSYDAATGKLTLKWDQPEGTERSIFRLIGKNGYEEATTNNFAVLSVVPGEKYTFELTSRTATSEYAAATPFQVDVPGLASVTGLTASLDQKNVELKWNPVAGATGYEVVVLGEAEMDAKRLDVGNVQSATVDLSAFSDKNEQFEIGVRARGIENSFGGYSTILYVNPGANYAGTGTGDLAAPTGLKAVYEEAGNRYLVTWTGDPKADRFIVNYNSSDTFVDGTENSVYIPAGAPGQTQSIIVYQRTVGGAYGPGVKVEVTTPDTTPVVPGKLTATAEGKDLIIDWPDIPGAVSYTVSIGNIAANGGDSRPTTTSEFKYEGGADKSFVFSVSGVDANGAPVSGPTYQGIWNAGGTEFADITEPPAAVTGGKVEVKGDKVIVTWDAGDADLYRVSASSTLGFVESPDLPRGTTSFEFDRSQFAAGSTWKFMVMARDTSSVFSVPAEADVTFPADPDNGGGAPGNPGGGENPGNGGGETPGTPGGENPAEGSGNGGAPAGNGGAGEAPGANTNTDPIKQSGEGDLALILGGALTLGGVALLVSPLIRRRKTLADDAA